MEISHVECMASRPLHENRKGRTAGSMVKVGKIYWRLKSQFDPPPVGMARMNFCELRPGRIMPWGKSLRSARLIRALISRGFLSCRLQKTAACPPKTYPHSARHNTHYVSLPQGIMRPLFRSAQSFYQPGRPPPGAISGILSLKG